MPFTTVSMRINVSDFVSFMCLFIVALPCVFLSLSHCLCIARQASRHVEEANLLDHIVAAFPQQQQAGAPYTREVLMDVVDNSVFHTLNPQIRSLGFDESRMQNAADVVRQIHQLQTVNAPNVLARTGSCVCVCCLYCNSMMLFFDTCVHLCLLFVL